MRRIYWIVPLAVLAPLWGCASNSDTQAPSPITQEALSSQNPAYPHPTDGRNLSPDLQRVYGSIDPDFPTDAAPGGGGGSSASGSR